MDAFRVYVRHVSSKSDRLVQSRGPNIDKRKHDQSSCTLNPRTNANYDILILLVRMLQDLNEIVC